MQCLLLLSALVFRRHLKVLWPHLHSKLKTLQMRFAQSSPFLTESYVHGLAAQKGNCLHLTGVEGSLGVRINGKTYVSFITVSILHALTPSFLTGVYAPPGESLPDTKQSLSYTHASSTGVRAVHDKTDFTWRIFDNDVCVAHWTEALPSASPESLHRA